VTEQYGRIHNQVVELLSAYIDDEVTAQEREMVEQHLTMCNACVQNLTTLRQTVTLLQELPQVAVPRPLTLRQADVEPVRQPRMSWWRLSWAQGLIAATAVLLIVAAIGGIFVFSRSARLPQLVALHAPPPPQASSVEKPAAAMESSVEGKTEVGAEKEGIQPTALAAAAEQAAPDLGIPQATAAPPLPTAPPRAAQEVPQPAAPPEPAVEPQPKAEASERGVRAADQAEASPENAANEPMFGAAAMPSATAQPALQAMPDAPTPTLTGTAPQPMAGAAAMPSATAQHPRQLLTGAPTPALMEVQDLNLQIEPGLIRVSGRLPLPEGRKLHAELWRNRQPADWAIPESQRTTVQAAGRFSFQLRARPEQPGYDLFGIPPADYEIRIQPIDPPEPVEARIPFDTYGPAPAGPTSSP
jgi:anti-sigma factor RsiW